MSVCSFVCDTFNIADCIKYKKFILKTREENKIYAHTYSHTLEASVRVYGTCLIEPNIEYFPQEWKLFSSLDVHVLYPENVQSRNFVDSKTAHTQFSTHHQYKKCFH